ncbi:hypothetical protein GF351_05640 [Candidatus Woesearchaeota archaeon]|nr:hypothetical protein [Candidatus Woesearchaeota archaeon]
MKKTVITALIVGLLLFAGIGCRPEPEPNNGTENSTEVLETFEPPVEYSQKDFRLKLSTIKSFQYNYSDTAMPEKDYYYYVRAFKQSAVLWNQREHYDGKSYDMIFMDKNENDAYAWCSNRYCKGEDYDFEAEEVYFSDYDMVDPRELGYSLKQGKLLRKEQMNNHIVEVVEFEDYDGNTGLMYIQSHYKIPLKAVYDNGRVIEYKKIHWNTVRQLNTDMPLPVKKSTREELKKEAGTAEDEPQGVEDPGTDSPEEDDLQEDEDVVIAS